MQGRVYLWQGRALYVGPGLAASRHAHHAVQICLPLSGQVRLRSSPQEPWGSYKGAVVPSDVPHESDAAVECIAALWLDAEAPEARRLVPAGRRSIAAIPESAIRSIISRLDSWRDNDLDDPERAATALEEIVGVLSPAERRSSNFDGRAMRARQLLRAAPMHTMRLNELSEAVSLSPSRLAHLFRAQLGLPVRRLSLWLRLQDAVQAIAGGATVTAAAHAAGFADAPHLDRTFRRMLGFTPSALLSVSQFVQCGPSARV